MGRKSFVLVVSGCLFLSRALVLASPLEEELARLRAAGIPVTLEELAPPEIPDEKNARFLYSEAQALVHSLVEEHRDTWDYFPFSGRLRGEVTEEKNREVVDYILNHPEFNRLVALLQEAAAMDCRFHYRGPFGESVSFADDDSDRPYLPALLSPMRSFARILAEKALVESEHGCVEAALSAVFSGLRLGDALAHLPASVARLVQLVADSFTLRNLSDVVGNIPPGNGDGTGGESARYEKIMQGIGGKRTGGDPEQMLVIILIEGREMFRWFRDIGEELFELREQEKRIIEEIRRAEAGDDEARLKRFLATFGVSSAAELEKRYRREKDELREEYERSGAEDLAAFIEEQEAYYLGMMRRSFPLLNKPWPEMKAGLDALSAEMEKGPLLRQVFSTGFITTMITQGLKHRALVGAAEIGLANGCV